ncbi:MAG TPA: hypothetical protein IAA46_01060 [Candidatus Gemmiger avium]|nr:hypothetical protein [Candidatus Gemmiger avium]
MRKAFMKRFAAVLMALCMLATLPVATAFAADDTGYIVTFRAGEHGSFTDEYITYLRDNYNTADEENVYVNEDKTVVAVLVADDKLAPNAPTPNSTLVTGEGSNYTVTTAVDANTSYVPGTAVTADYDFVAEYALKGDRNEGSYLVQYLRQGTDEEVAPSVRGTATVGLPLTLTAIAVDEFTVVGSAVQTQEILEDGQTVFTFYYTQNVHVNTVTEYVDGDVVVNYNDVNLVGGAGVVGGGDGAGDGGEEIPDEETPQAGGEDIPDESTPQAGGEEIPDESTPEAGGETAQAGVSMPMVIGGVVGLLAILLIVLVALRKRKGGQEEE